MVDASLRKLIDRTQAFSALQEGVWVPLPEGGDIGVNLVDFACALLAIDDSQFDDQVRTLLLNNGVVDHPRTTSIHEGDVLVLSGAMPGLVGAMLRSDSPIKSMRATITGSRVNRRTIPFPGYIQVKAFNTILRDHASDILSYGASVEDRRDISDGG